MITKSNLGSWNRKRKLLEKLMKPIQGVWLSNYIVPILIS